MKEGIRYPHDNILILEKEMNGDITNWIEYKEYLFIYIIREYLIIKHQSQYWVLLEQLIKKCSIHFKCAIKTRIICAVKTRID